MRPRSSSRLSYTSCCQNSCNDRCHWACNATVRLLWSGDVNTPFGVLPVVATEFVEGISLAERISAAPMTQTEVAAMGRDVASAINVMWARRIVHRDLKPSNVMVAARHSCVIDLGLARHLDQSSLTALGATWGTYGYLSPEQTRAVRQLTCKSDIFALGILMVEALCGRHPSNGDQAQLLKLRLHERLPRRARAVDYSALLAQLLHPRPTARPMPNVVLERLTACLTQ